MHKSICRFAIWIAREFCRFCQNDHFAKTCQNRGFPGWPKPSKKGCLLIKDCLNSDQGGGFLELGALAAKKKASVIPKPVFSCFLLFLSARKLSKNLACSSYANLPNLTVLSYVCPGWPNLPKSRRSVDNCRRLV